MRKGGDEDEEEDSEATLGLEQKGKRNVLASLHLQQEEMWIYSNSFF